MSARFRLPDGTEATVNMDKRPVCTTWLEHPTLGLIGIAPDRLTEVPGEPPNGEVLSDGLNVFTRQDDPDELDREGRWYCTGVERIYRWAELAPRAGELGANRLRRMIFEDGQS